MKTAALFAVLLGLLPACEAPVYPANGTGDLLLAASLQRAIIVQSTLFPYHFVPGSAELNALAQLRPLALQDFLQLGALFRVQRDAEFPGATARDSNSLVGHRHLSPLAGLRQQGDFGHCFLNWFARNVRALHFSHCQAADADRRARSAYRFQRLARQVRCRCTPLGKHRWLGAHIPADA